MLFLNYLVKFVLRISCMADQHGISLYVWLGIMRLTFFFKSWLIWWTHLSLLLKICVFQIPKKKKKKIVEGICSMLPGWGKTAFLHKAGISMSDFDANYLLLGLISVSCWADVFDLSFQRLLLHPAVNLLAFSITTVYHRAFWPNKIRVNT